MEKPLAGSDDPARDAERNAGFETIFVPQNEKVTADAVIDEKTLENGQDTSDGSDSGHIPHVYEVDNMERDEKGRLVVQTSELAITVIHVDDDQSLSPWTFRTFFIGKSTT